MNVLLIDDDELILDQVDNWFTREGYQVTQTSSGHDGIRAALSKPFDLIVCDVSMPEMSGYSVLEELRNHPETATTPFIFLTGQTEKSFMRYGMELGADDYLTKPFTRAELLSAVQTRMKRRAALTGSVHREISELKSNLARMVTHELKTPMVNIDLVKQIIERQIDHVSHDEIKKLVESLGVGTDRLSHLIEQMVFVTQFDSGILDDTTLIEQGAEMQVWQILPGAIDLGRRFAFRNKSLDIVSAEHDSDMAVVAHGPALKHALAEIVANALNYSPEDSRIEVDAWKADGWVWMRVVDWGPGMTPEQRETALRPFEQVNRERHEQQGIGLGLPLANRIVQAHGGGLELHSPQGQGLLVIIRLPSA